MDILIICSLLVLGLASLVKRIAKVKNFRLPTSIDNVFKFLLVWIILGFLLGLDYSEAFGCVIGFESIFIIENLLFPSLSFGIMLFAFLMKNQKLKKVLVIIELLFWVFKLLLVKGGYIVGFAGSPDGTIVLYDLIAIVTRLYLLSKLYHWTKHRIVKLRVVSILIIGIKIFIFNYPLYSIYQDQVLKDNAIELRQDLVGKWNGEFRITEEDEHLTEKGNVNIVIDSISIHFDSLSPFKGSYKFILEYPTFGFLESEEESHDLYLEKRGADSLKIFIYHFGRDNYSKNIEFKIKKY